MKTTLRSPFFAERLHTHRPLRPWSILGLVLVPLLIAGVLLGTAWGRDERLQRIEAAVVNLDQAVKVKGQLVPMGRQLAAEVTAQDNPNIHWVLSDPSDAAEGLASGRYSAVVTIPKNFSRAATSVADADKAEQAVVQVTTSPASAVEDARIARQVADLAAQATNRMLTGEYLKNIYVGFNTMGEQFVTMSQAARQLADGAGQLDDGTAKAARGTGQLGKGLATLDASSGRLVAGGDELAAGGAKLADGAGTLASGITRYTDGAGQVVDGIGQLDQGVQQYTSGASKLVGGIGQLDQGVQQLNEGVQKIPAPSAAQLQQLQDGMAQLEQLTGGLEGIRATLTSTAQAEGTLPAATQAGARARQQCEAQTPAPPAGSCEVVQGYVTSTVDQATRAAAKQALGGFSQLDPQALAGIEQLGQLPAQLGQVSQLKQGVAQLARGSQQLATSSQQLATGGAELAKGSATLAEQSTALATGGTELAKGSATLASRSQELASGGAELAKGSATLATRSQQLKQGGAELAKGAQGLSGGITRYTDGVGEFVDGVRQYTDGVHRTNLGAQELAGGMTQLAAGTAKLADGTDRFADGLETGKDKVPSYSQEQRERLSTVVSDPVTGAADTVSSPLVQTTTLLLVLGSWLGALTTWLLMRPVASRTLTSSRPSWQLAAATILPSAGIAVAQALLLGVLGARVLHLGLGRGLGLVAFLALVGVAFMAVNQALAAWLGGLGRMLAVVLATVTAAVGLVSAVPGVFGAVHGASPLAPALDGVRAIAARTTIGAGPIGTLLALWLVAAVACLLAVVRRRRPSVAAYRRARGGEVLR